MHECVGAIRLREYRMPGLARWLTLLLVPAGVVVALWAYLVWSFSPRLERLETLQLVAVIVGYATVPVLLAVLVGVVRGRLARGPGRRAGIDGPGRVPSGGYATRLCPHGIALTHGAEAGRVLPWSEVADLRVFPGSSGRGGVAAARLRAHLPGTGLPPVARLVEDGSVPADPAWLWLGGVADPAEADRVTTQVARWRETSPR